MSREDLLSYGVAWLWAGVFVAIAYLAAHILARFLKPGIVRALLAVPLYLSLCAVVFFAAPSLALGIGILVGAIFGIPAGVVALLMVLARLDNCESRNPVRTYL